MDADKIRGCLKTEAAFFDASRQTIQTFNGFLQMNFYFYLLIFRGHSEFIEDGTVSD
jgi:hypothetical protein